ncbi:MAG: hypothetical protein ACTSYD_02695 [Candidatus Heimdallarchaeaceae archaeon]
MAEFNREGRRLVKKEIKESIMEIRKILAKLNRKIFVYGDYYMNPSFGDEVVRLLNEEIKKFERERSKYYSKKSAAAEKAIKKIIKIRSYKKRR